MKKPTSPPKLFEWLVWLMLLPDDRETFLGDLEETYRQKTTKRGKIKAIIWYIFIILRLIPPFFENLFYVRILTSIISILNLLTSKVVNVFEAYTS